MIWIIGTIFFLAAIAASAQGEIRGEPVEYSAGGTTMKGYLAYDDGHSEKRPGILVVHEWWGHDEYARRRARFTDPKRIGAIGYCFGGSVVLQMARDGMDLGGVASFHGGLTTTSPAKPGAIKARVLVLTGADDKFVPPGQVEDFQKERKAARADYRVVSYPGAFHSFTNPAADDYAKKFNLPLGYNADADAKSWAEMQKFFKEGFGK